MATRLILIRHGSTKLNAQRRYCGLIDARMNKKGESDIRRLCGRIRQEKIHKVYSSDRRRAIDSARIIFKGCKIERVPALREIHFGIFEGLNHRQIAKLYPSIYKRWLANPHSAVIPKGENLKKFKRRVLKAFAKIISLNRNKTTAVVCHGGTISIFITKILKSKEFWKHIPASASFTLVEYRKKKPVITVFNDTSHLNGKNNLHSGRRKER